MINSRPFTDISGKFARLEQHQILSKFDTLKLYSIAST